VQEIWHRFLRHTGDFWCWPIYQCHSHFLPMDRCCHGNKEIENFNTKFSVTRPCRRYMIPSSCTCQPVFRISQFNSVIEIYPQVTPLTTVMRIWIFWHKFGYCMAFVTKKSNILRFGHFDTKLVWWSYYYTVMFVSLTTNTVYTATDRCVNGRHN